ncbi:MAG: hypothetical protein COY40_03140 [Alphaproteobacteria bacterium CG_4_10_14_0_8_um_filter_53_9]|nr:MAG: hypothetical protein COY40_03140 [Alphaproteobacteria bacterium CG_4_10_14_0_8_um_filter_53_9]
MKIVDIANYFIHRVLQEGEDGIITNLKVQKLCYYAQGFHLALNDGEPLFDESLEAWKHGPVSRTLYASLADYGANPITALIASGDDIDKLSIETKSFLDDIYSEFGQFSAWALREMTHKEPPWQNNWDETTQQGQEISHADLKKYFETCLNNVPEVQN